VASAILALDGHVAVLRLEAAEHLATAPRDHYAVLAGLRLALAGERDDAALVAATALIETGDVSAIWPLAVNWEEGDLHARRVAERLEPADVDEILERRAVNGNEEAAIGEILQVMAPRAAPLLAQRCASRHRRVRLRAVQALGFSEDPGDADVLAARLGDRSAEVRLTALRAMSKLDVSSPQVLRRLNDRDEFVRMAAALLLGRVATDGRSEALHARFGREKTDGVRSSILQSIALVDGSDALPLLESRLCEATGGAHYQYPTGTANAAARALKDLGQPGIDVLLSHAEDPDPVVRDAVFRAICELPREERVAEVMVAALRDERRYVGAYEALSGQWDNPRPDRAVVALLLPMLGDPDPTIRARTCRALPNWGEPAIIDRVWGLFRDDPDPEVRGQALRALGHMAVPGLRVTAEPLVEGDDPVLSEYATQALAGASLREMVDRRQAETLDLVRGMRG
jgi:HEAT repeat protein